ncbi:hypothetical protein CBR_g42112 [Chara braunii]|uniref:SMP domain-containing protein n=1 Tax=Chara braunii TaxID=69332 RepID=A0A388LX80_CHABU|nr:hypothetical protein CBR_g42112 [Chara braunii]|eukprot:GBG86829.1 hypothetical protein CBR_g42112 [Chara braunii]
MASQQQQQQPITMEDVLQEKAGGLAEKPVTPAEATALHTIEQQEFGWVQKGEKGVAAKAQAAANRNVLAGYADPAESVPAAATPGGPAPLQQSGQVAQEVKQELDSAGADAVGKMAEARQEEGSAAGPRGWVNVAGGQGGSGGPAAAGRGGLGGAGGAGAGRGTAGAGGGAFTGPTGAAAAVGAGGAGRGVVAPGGRAAGGAGAGSGRGGAGRGRGAGAPGAGPGGVGGTSATTIITGRGMAAQGVGGAGGGVGAGEAQPTGSGGVPGQGYQQQQTAGGQAGGQGDQAGGQVTPGGPPHFRGSEDDKGKITIGDVLRKVGIDQLSKPITPSDAEAIKMAESLAVGHQTMKGSLGAHAQSAANNNVAAGLIRPEQHGSAAAAAGVGAGAGQTGQAHTLGEVLADVDARLEADKPITLADAARIEQVEKRAHPLGIVEPGGVAAAAMEAARKNAGEEQEQRVLQSQH